MTDEERNAFVTDRDLAEYASGEVRIPTLLEVLKLVKENNARVNIEIKTLPRMYEGIAKKVMEMVKEMGMIEQTLISSFDHEQLVAVRKISPDIASAVLTGDRIALPDVYLGALDADAYNPGCYGGYDSLGFDSEEGKLVTTAIDACLNGGYDVNVWTCNKKEQMRPLIEAGVSGLITDIPNRVGEVLSE